MVYHALPFRLGIDVTSAFGGSRLGLNGPADNLRRRNYFYSGRALLLHLFFLALWRVLIFSGNMIFIDDVKYPRSGAAKKEG
jgi:hypothetical protein